MRGLIGFNIIMFAVCFIIVAIMYDGTFKEKLIMMCAESFFMGLLSIGVYLLST